MSVPVAKRALRSILVVPWVNRAVVAALRALPDLDWKARCPVVGSAELRLAAGTVRMHSADRCHVARELFWGGGALRTAADRFALDAAVRLGAVSDLFLDVGAYTGLFALAVARGSTRPRCHAYEIVPENFELLWANVIRNDLVTRVAPSLVGLGATPGIVKVPAALGMGSLASSIALDHDAGHGVSIPVDTIDARYGGFTGRMTIKLDVEGFEWPVMQGADALIRRVKPDMICEVLRRAQGVVEMQAYLLGQGYRFYQFTASGLVRRDAIEATRTERDWLFTARAEPELAELGIALDATRGEAQA